MDDAYAYEVAAERAALHKAVHGPVKTFFQAHGLEAEHGPFPLFWKDLAGWAPFKEVYRQYSRWADGGGSLPRAAAAGAVPTPALTPVAEPAPPPAEPAPALPAAEEQPASEQPSAPAARKRKRWSERPEDSAAAPAPAADDPAAQAPAAKAPQRKQRWTVDARLTADGKPPMAAPTFRSRTRFGNRIVPAATTLLPPGATPLQEVLFLTRLQLDEIAARVMLLPAELKRVEADPARSPSPDAEYDSTGKRLNSREQRMRRALDAQRDVLLERLMDLNPTMCNGGSGPKFLRKVYIPYREFPNVNFMGMVIGPRGNTQKHLEKDTNCKISVRGRGAKGSESSAMPATGAESLAQKKRREDDEDELHVQITAERLSELEACVTLITDILKPPADDDQSAVRKLQLLQVTAPEGRGRVWATSAAMLRSFTRPYLSRSPPPPARSSPS